MFNYRLFGPWGLTLLSVMLTAMPDYALANTLKPVELKTEYTDSPLGIDAVNPRLSWKSTASARNARQTGYRVQVAATEADLAAGNLLWDSDRVNSNESLFIPYEGPALASGQRVVWRVKVWNGNGEPSDWSETGYWEMGLLGPEDWAADWIYTGGPVDTGEKRPVALMRDEFQVSEGVARARLYATARGTYELELNGKQVGNQVLAPGWTSYDHRIQYQTYDVTDLLRAGDNAIGAMLADGWYRGYLGWGGKRNLYGDQTALRLQLHITYEDGTETVIGTDRSWKSTHEGPWRMADIYNGEIYDARREMAGWSVPGLDDSTWQNVDLYQGEPVALVAPQGPPIKAMEEIKPVSISKAPNGEILVDMGQNMVGWVRLQLAGTAGTEVVIRHAEVLDPEGNLYMENLRTANQTDTYIMAGNGNETWEPRFTFHGFRYVGISGYADELALEDIAGVVVHSDMERTGHWESSEPMLNQLYHNIVWGQKGNFLDVPTDCPQRDERLGWTGDAQVFAPTAAFNMDVSGFFAKWLGDLALDQKDSGSVPHVIPDVLDADSHGTAGWADAATVVPWTMYRAYGDTRLLERQFASMTGWVDYVSSQADDDLIWRPGYQFGDWLSPQFHDVFAPYRAITGNDFIATAYYARSADLVSRTAAVLGRKSDARKYRRLFEQVRRAFQREFMTPAGRLAYETQTAYVLALAFHLLPESAREEAAARLAADVRERGNHLTTGFLGTPELTRVLSDYGQTKTAYDLLTQTTYPSWLYPVTFGSTTIWERWDAIRPDGTFQSPEMTSFNHYAYGAIGEWMVKVVAGLDADDQTPGYKRLLIRPKPGGGLSRARASLETPYGPAVSAWRFDGDAFTLEVTVAPNTTAEVVLPLAAGKTITENGKPLASRGDIEILDDNGVDVRLQLGSGSYSFTYNSPELLKQAMDFTPFTESTTLSAIIADPIGNAAVKTLMPEYGEGSQLPTSVSGMKLSELLEFVPNNESVISLIDALPEINAERRVSVFGVTDAN